MLILKNARLVTPAEVVDGTLSIDGRLIHAIDCGSISLPQAIDFEGDYLIPGIVDIHTDALERHLTPRPNVHWPVRAALTAHDAQIAAAGITTVFDSLAFGTHVEEAARMLPMLRSTVAAIASDSNGMRRAEHLIHLRLELPHPDTVSYCEEFIDLPVVRLLSVMDHTPGQGQFINIEKLRAQYRGNTDEEEFLRRINHRRELREKHAEGNRRALAGIARERGLPLASHDDRTVEDVDLAMSLGATISEFPVTLEAAGAAHRHGMAVAMGAPNVVLGGSHSGNVAAGDIAREGCLDILTSDYVPNSILNGIFLLNEQVGMSLPQSVAAATLGPARAAGLKDRGALQPGLRADLARVRVSGNHPYVISVWRQGQQVI
jgi:alpha-D-ribose 1-methylphosphonate 5-triphosphate diphosphatase